MRSVDTHEAILVVAAAMYAERGYDGVSVRDIATAVAIQPASLYHHFKDKDALILAALEHVLSVKAAPGCDILLSQQAPEQRLDAFIDWLARLFFDDPAFARIAIRGALDGDNQRRAYLAKTVIDGVFAPLSQLIAGLSDGVDPGPTAASIISLVVGHRLLASTFVHLPRQLLALCQVDAFSAYIQDFVRRSLCLPRRLESAP